MDQGKVGGRVSFEEDDNGATGLIANLSHSLLNVRVRALKSILSKIDCGLIRPESLSYRVDLLQKLHPFLSSDPRDSEGLQFTLKLLLILAQHKDFSDTFNEIEFEKHLNKLRLDVSEDVGAQVDEILDAVDGYFSQLKNCDLIMKSSNYSIPYSFHSSISSSFDHGDFHEDHSYHNLSSDRRDEEKSVKKKSSVIADQEAESSFLAHHYFPPQCYNDEDPYDETETWIKKPPIFEIPALTLESSDRRVVASTIESLMSKNEPLIFITCSFFRDILLSDFPSENFLQEPSLLLELIQVLEDPNEDKRLNYISFQCLLSFSYKLRIRFQRLNSTDYYHSSNGFPSKVEIYNERHSLQSNSDLLCSNMCKVLKSISRYIYYKAKRKTYIILQDISFTLLALSRIFPINTKELFLNLQEIFQDLRHGYEKNPNHPVPLALTISNLLNSIKKNLNEEEPLILSRDIRRFIKNLCASKVMQNYPDVFKRLIETSTPYEPSLKPIHEKLSNSSRINEEELSKLIEDIDVTSSGRDNYWEREESSYQYALDSYPLKGSGKMSREDSHSGSEEKRGVKELLYDIQNATGHKVVLNSLEALWETSLILMLNGLKLELKFEEEWKEGPWRDSFFRFLSVEPTSREDEQLLTNILDFFTFFLRVVKDGSRYGEWIIPLCLEKGCVGLRMIAQPVNKPGMKSTDVGSTYLPSITRAWLDLYVILLNPALESFIDEEQLWELFSTYVFILEETIKNDFAPTVILPFVFEALAILTSNKRIVQKLKRNHTLMISLTHLSCQAISFVEKKVSDGSNRNCGIVHHSSALLHHLTLLLAREDRDLIWDYLGKSYEVIPFLWSSQDPAIRAYGFQICSILTSIHKGFSVLLLGVQSTLLLWSSAYSHVMDLEEVAIVKERAIEVLSNFLTYWKEFGENELSLSGPKIVDDAIRILNNLTWEAEMSSLVLKTKNVSKDVVVSNYSGNGDSDTLKCFITPRVVIGICKFLEKLCKISSPKITRDSSNSSLAVTLFGLLGSNKISGSSRPNWWNNSCSALSCILETLISLSQFERCVSLIIIGDRINFSKMMKLFSLKPPTPNGKSEIPSVLSGLWINMFTLLSVLLSDSGTHFEDIERHIFTHRSYLLPRLIDWLSNQSGVKCRKSALNFLFRFLSMLSAISKDKREKTYNFLCTIWEEKEMTYGASIANSLIDIYEDSLEHDEKIEILKSLAALFSLSPSSKKFAIDHDFVGVLIERIRIFSLKCFEPSESLHGKRLNCWQEETFWVISVLSSILYSTKEGKEAALANQLSDSVHKIFKLWMLNADRTILLAFIELFINFTDEFINGVHSMILTTNMLGVAPRKAPTAHSIFVEFLSILINELENNDKNPHLKTIEMSFILLQNCCSLPECRTITAKSQLLNFIGRLHLNETKKWNVKQNHIKQIFLDFLVHASLHSDIQLAIPKIQEATEILLLIIDFESPPVSTLALKVIRNLCFQPGNRARFYCDNAVMLAMSAKLRQSDGPEEAECAALSLSALIANSEKGKLLAKKSDVPRSLLTALHKFKKSEKKFDGVSSQKKIDHSSLIQLLTNLGSLSNASE